MAALMSAAVILTTSCSGGGRSAHTEENEEQETLFGFDKMATVDLEMPEETWQKIVSKASDKNYRECSVTVNGERFDNVAIRTKGASSLDDVKLMKSDRYSFTLKLNKYEKGQSCQGLTKLLLNNNIWDATQMKDAVVYDMCRYIGLPAPRTNYARITLNGKLHGYYLLVEPIDKRFCRHNWPDEDTNIYKPYHNLAYKGEDMKHYTEISDYAKVRGGEASMQRVVEALKSVDEGRDIEEHVDVESVMKYMALQTIAVNFDCMTGNNTQNYYLREADGIGEGADEGGDPVHVGGPEGSAAEAHQLRRHQPAGPGRDIADVWHFYNMKRKKASPIGGALLLLAGNDSCL